MHLKNSFFATHQISSGSKNQCMTHWIVKLLGSPSMQLYLLLIVLFFNKTGLIKNTYYHLFCYLPRCSVVYFWNSELNNPLKICIYSHTHTNTNWTGPPCRPEVTIYNESKSNERSDVIGVRVRREDDIPIQRGNLSEFPHSRVTLRRGGRRTQIPTRRTACDLTVHLREYLPPAGRMLAFLGESGVFCGVGIFCSAGGWIKNGAVGQLGGRKQSV